MKQVVILCGGQGKRLRPLTKNLPKPMVKINGKPFLWHLINQFKNYGVKNFLLLTGYKSKIIREYFADGSELGLNIDYDNGPVEWKTNKRLYNARKKIRKNFILMYSDNFVNYPFEKMRQFHIKEKKPLTLFLSKKNKGNIKLGKDLKILKYDKLRGKSNFNYVEIGYMFASKKKTFFVYI